MNDEIKTILSYLDLYKNLEEGLLPSRKKKLLLDYITNLQHTEDLYNQLLKDYDELQQENEKLREERNGKQLQEMHKINNYDYFKEMTNNWNREDFSRRCYDLCNEKVDLQQRIEKAIEYMKKHIEKCNIDGNEGKFDNFDIFTKPQELLNILNGRSDE